MAFESTAEVLKALIDAIGGIEVDAQGGRTIICRCQPNEVVYRLDKIKGTMAKMSPDGVGFEPTVRLHARRFSRPLP
jgi:hypothetical protein